MFFRLLVTNTIGISAYYHDSAAALIQNGTIAPAAQHERFTRKKHDPDFPAQSEVALLGVYRLHRF